MRWTLSFLLFFGCSLSCSADETPREFVRRFYAAYKTWDVYCVPRSEQEPLISPFCGMEIIRVFRRVNDQRKEWNRKFPPDPSHPVKPPWSGEDVFINRYERVAHFAIGQVSRDRGRIIVQAHLELVDQGQTYPWTDRVILDRAGDSWVIADIEYAGGGTLLTSTQRELDQIEKNLVKKP